MGPDEPEHSMKGLRSRAHRRPDQEVKAADLVSSTHDEALDRPAAALGKARWGQRAGPKRLSRPSSARRPVLHRVFYMLPGTWGR
jgi:hypothetical protein